MAAARLRKIFWLLAAGVSWPLAAAQAQSWPGPAYFLRHPTSAPPLALGLLPPAPVPAAPALAPLPNWRATAPLREAAPEAPRRDLTGPRAYPVYDPYQNLPETFRKYTLPEARLEPFPVQVLRGLLGP